MTKATEIKITVCPPGPENVHFQKQAFDMVLGNGFNPHRYENSHRRKIAKFRRGRSRGGSERTENFRYMLMAREALKNHENRDEILKILRTDVR